MKQRKDYVSNSSSCSYIISTPEPPKTIIKKLCKYYKDEYSCRVTEKILQSCECMVPIEIKFEQVYDDDKTPRVNYISPVLLSIHGDSFRHGRIDVDLSHYFFDDSGELKKDLVFPDAVRPFGSLRKLRGTYTENDVIWEYAVSCKVPLKAIKLCRWILENAGTLNDEYDHKKFYLSKLDEMEQEIKNGKHLYMIYFTYEGDGFERGHIRDDNTSEKGVCQKLQECPFVDKVIYGELM